MSDVTKRANPGGAYAEGRSSRITVGGGVRAGICLQWTGVGFELEVSPQEYQSRLHSKPTVWLRVFVGGAQAP